MKIGIKALPWHFWTGFICLLFFSGLMIGGFKPISIFFYPFLWWSYIIAIDGLNLKINGSSLFSRLKARFFLLIACSFAFWIFFELLNLRIENWHYRYDGPSLTIFSDPFFKIAFIGLFGFLSFSTVIPAIMETYELLKGIGLWRNAAMRKWKWWGRPAGLWSILGWGMLLSPLIWPDYFFWAVWLALIFIIDPILGKKDDISFFAQLREGNLSFSLQLMTAGLLCGFLWEIGNYWVGLKWQYDVPFGNGYKIFEMPLLGYGGYLFFAIECFVVYNALRFPRLR